jgi:hypothetical protein
MNNKIAAAIEKGFYFLEFPNYSGGMKRKLANCPKGE